MKKILFITAVLVFAIASCMQESEDQVTKILKYNNYSNIVLTGYEIFGCGRDDTFRTGFTATAPNGETVEGVVCSGIFKGSTIRIK